MKKIFTLLALAMATVCQSQPTMTSANDAAIGDEFVFVFVDSSTITEGSAGALQTWDFSNATPSGLQRVENWEDPAGTPFASNYPGSNIVQVSTDSAGNVYSYLTKSTSQTELNGIVSSILGSTADMHYTNSHILRQYPASYNSTTQDTYEGMAIVSVGPVTTTSYRTGSYEYVIDGYGTLITPSGNFPNTLRLRIHQQFTDSTVFIGVPLPAQVINGFSTTYFWGSCDAGDKLYQFYIGYDTTIAQATTSAFKSASFQDNTTGINEIAPHEKRVLTYPVPTKETVTIRINEPVIGNIRLELFDHLGSAIKSINVESANSDYFEWSIGIKELPAGLYSVQISSQEQKWLSRFIKE